MNEPLEKELKPAGKDPGIPLLIFFLFFVALLTKMNWIAWVLIPLLIIVGVGWIKRKTVLRVTREELCIDRFFMGYRWTKKYSIRNMESIWFRKNVKADSYSSSTTIRVLGADLTPEDSKKYYHYPEVLSFLSGGKEIEIGKGYKAFGGEEILARINELRSRNDPPPMQW